MVQLRGCTSESYFVGLLVSVFLSPQNRAKQAELKLIGNAYQPLSPSFPLLPALLIPHCCYKPMAIVRHSYFTLLPPLHAPSMPQDILVILSIVMDSYIAPLLRFHVPTTPKTLLNWIGYTQVLILRPVNPHCNQNKN